jgi:hypothetical protein
MIWPRTQSAKYIHFDSVYVQALIVYPGHCQFQGRTWEHAHFLSQVSFQSDTTLAIMIRADENRFPIHVLWGEIVESDGQQDRPARGGQLVIESPTCAHYRLQVAFDHYGDEDDLVFDPSPWFRFVESVRDVIEMNVEEEASE